MNLLLNISTEKHKKLKQDHKFLDFKRTKVLKQKNRSEPLRFGMGLPKNETSLPIPMELRWSPETKRKSSCQNQSLVMGMDHPNFSQ